MSLPVEHARRVDSRPDRTATAALDDTGRSADSTDRADPAGPDDADDVDPLLARQRRRESSACSYPRRLPLALVSGNGVTVRDSRGNEYVDCLAGAGALPLGHNHPVVVAAIEKALRDELPLTTLDLATPAKDAFVEQLFAVLPGELGRTGRIQFCGPSGADAVEAALKLAKTATGRTGLVAFGGGYHGMTHGALALTGARDPKVPLGPLVPDVHHLPYPTAYRCPFGTDAGHAYHDAGRGGRPGGNGGGTGPGDRAPGGRGGAGEAGGAGSIVAGGAGLTTGPGEPGGGGTRFASERGADASAELCARTLDWALRDGHSGITPPASVIVEPVQGEGGVHPLPARFARSLRAATRAAEAVLIADEVQTGLGRTGSLWASTPLGLDPDVMVLSKAIGGGLPLAVIVYRDQLDVWAPGAHAGTFRGNQLAMATGAATIGHVVREGLAAHAAAMGERLLTGLRQAVPAGCDPVGDVRGRGLMVGVELVDVDRLGPTGVPEPDGATAARLQRAMLDRGVIVELGGRDDAVVRFLPPLIIQPHEIDHVVDVFARALADVIRERHR